ncbi:zinc finger CCCH domain-containing protein 62-like [Lycium barbarum]|uniref:zinc finger CCCH domain-containing protein 62-like n=1 Tax=Lycium barbarum TaxID=112863 RepID=UPI00293F5BE0|nr:zinc finger CCCH domain-containing protein 62-like [Lycium barbarum]
MEAKQQYDVSDSESDYDSDDSQDDPTFDILEETRFSLSKMSIKKNASKDMSARRNVSKALEECVEGEKEQEKIVPELDEKDQKSYETVQKIIKAGQIEKLKVEQCKVYLRKHGLRLTGSKDTLIQRIKEHTDIVDGRGEEKYPPSSFVLNCKGDACTGDVVMFEQNVYEMFNIASRSATGPPCGTRIVAGRIVKESYGAKKQQHTFTVEVLWSKGEKPLPPLHPLLIKGRNLYRLKTLRQKWDNEAERQKILSEKHARGFVARSNRETRVREKEMRQMRKENRVSTDHKEKKTEAESKGRMPHQHQKNTEHIKGKLLHSLSMNLVNKKDQPQIEVVDNGQKDEQKERRKYTTVIQENVFSRENRPEERFNQRQPLTNVNHYDPSSYREQRGFGESYTSNPSKSPLRMHNSNTHMPMRRGSSNGGNMNSNNNSPLRMHNSNAHNIPPWMRYNEGGYGNRDTSRSPLRGHGHTYTTYGHSQNMNYRSPQRTENWQARNGWCDEGGYGNRDTSRSPLRGHGHTYTTYGHSQNMNYRSPQRTENWQARNGWCDAGAAKRPFQEQREEQKRPCRFYAQGRCYYGHNCKYLHDSVNI